MTNARRKAVKTRAITEALKKKYGVKTAKEAKRLAKKDEILRLRNEGLRRSVRRPDSRNLEPLAKDIPFTDEDVRVMMRGSEVRQLREEIDTLRNQLEREEIKHLRDIKRIVLGIIDRSPF